MNETGLEYSPKSKAYPQIEYLTPILIRTLYMVPLSRYPKVYVILCPITYLEREMVNLLTTPSSDSI